MIRNKEQSIKAGNNMVSVSNDTLYFADEQIAAFIDGDLDPADREEFISIISKNPNLRRKVSDYVRFRRYKDTDEVNNECKVPSAVTEKALSLFNKYKRQTPKTDNYDDKEPVYISYTKSEFEINGIIVYDDDDKVSVELHITKNGIPYKGEVYLYRGKELYKQLISNTDTITCNLENKGNYHLFIKEEEVKTVDLEFELN